MEINNRKVVGALLFAGSVQFILFLNIAEALYPGYRVSDNYISDLGIGATSIIFNSSVFLLGLTGVINVYFFQRSSSFKFSFIRLTFFLTGLGAMGVGLFPRTTGIIHGAFALSTFICGGLSAIISYKLQKSPFSYFSILLGALTLSALTLFILSIFTHPYPNPFFLMGLGMGGIERMIVYPVLLWGISFGGYLIGVSNNTPS